MSWEWVTTNAGLIVAGVSAVAAASGLILNWRALVENTKTRQLQLLNEVFRSIRDTELLLYTKYKKASPEERRDWNSLFFNSLEHFAFLVNEGFIKDKKMVGFFDEAVIAWYEEIFQEHYSSKEIRNSKEFREFKKLYHALKIRHTA
jgi:hypothetical protein